MSLQKEKYSSDYATPALSHAGQPGVGPVIDLVRAGEAFVEIGKGKSVRREMNPRIVKAFGGVQGITVARCFLEACNQEPDLKSAAEEQGMDLDGFQEMLDEADRNARENPKGER